MDILELMKTRHSVRVYNERPLEPQVIARLREIIDECNSESGLNIQLCLNKPEMFTSFFSYGSFKNVNNYIALIGTPSEDLQEKCGWYGEKIVLKMTEMGLCSCWVAASYKKSRAKRDVADSEKLVCVIAIGYADNKGSPRKTKSIEALSRVVGEMPDWFRRGMEAAQLAPTAMNQQKFTFALNGNTVSAKAGIGVLTKLDLGIVKYHFELGAGDADWKWA